jgi:hypothetical protein
LASACTAVKQQAATSSSEHLMCKSPAKQDYAFCKQHRL